MSQKCKIGFSQNHYNFMNNTTVTSYYECWSSHQWTLVTFQTNFSKRFMAIFSTTVPATTVLIHPVGCKPYTFTIILITPPAPPPPHKEARLFPLGGADLRCSHFSAEMYVKTKELSPVWGGGRRRRPPWICHCFCFLLTLLPWGYKKNSRLDSR